MSAKENLFLSVFVHKCLMVLNDVEYDRLWQNDNAVFIKRKLKRSNKEIIARLRDKRFECCIPSNICEQRLKQRGFASLT